MILWRMRIGEGPRGFLSLVAVQDDWPTGSYRRACRPKPLTEAATQVPTMVRLAQDRLTPYGERAQVLASEGTVNFGVPDHSTDCVLSTYVRDLLSETSDRRFL